MKQTKPSPTVADFIGLMPVLAGQGWYKNRHEVIRNANGECPLTAWAIWSEDHIIASRCQLSRHDIASGAADRSPTLAAIISAADGASDVRSVILRQQMLRALEVTP